MASLDTIISMQSDTIEAATSQAAALANRISNWIPNSNVGSVSFRHTVSKPNMTKPVGLTDWLPEDEREDDLRLLDSEAEKWVDKYFPQINACLKSKPEEWLCAILGGGEPFADSQAIFDSVWHQARDNAYKVRDSMAGQVRADFGSRGFTLPPGAMIGALLQAEEAASDAIAGVNLDEARRIAEIKLDLLKFAEQQAITLKLGIMQSLANFYQQWANLPERGVELAKAKAQVYASLQSTLAEYYRVEMGFEELRLRSAQARADVAVSNDRNKASILPRNEAAGALATATRAFGDIAAAAASSQAAMIADLNAGG